MNFVALKMLTGDRAKYLGLIFAIGFCTFLLENETSIFASILKRTGSQILGCFTGICPSPWLASRFSAASGSGSLPWIEA